MSTLEYPLVCWRMEDGAILGMLAGFSQQMIAPDVRKLKAGFSDFLEKKLRRGEFEDPELQNARLKTLKVKVRPHYYENAKLYPVSERIELELAVVYGSTDFGQYLGLIPLLDTGFYFYQERDLNKLAEHFARERLMRATPSEIYRLLLPPALWLESVSVNAPRQEDYGKQRVVESPVYPTLLGISEQLPYHRKDRPNLMPEQAWERGDLVHQLISVLTREGANVLLVGKPGVGKSAIIQEMIRTLTARQKQGPLVDRHSFWRSNPARMVSKAKYLGEWQQVCEEVVEELSQAHGLLWMENFVSMATTGGEGAEDSMAAFMTPFLREGKLRMVSEVTPEQLEAMRRIMPGFVDHFRLISIPEMDEAATRRIFGYYNDYSSRNLGVSFSPQALEQGYALLDRFVRYESFPGKAIQFLSSCTQSALLNKQELLGQDTVIDTFSRRSGLPGFLLRDDQLLDSQELKQYFLDRIKGQDHVVDQVCSIIKIFKAGLNDPNKPVATLLFAGPTGVGKTALARALAAYFFGLGQKNKPLIRLDMSEFQHPGQIYRLIGPEGKLVQHVRESPFSVVLFDEIEKANPLIFDALLTLMDEGLLIDAAGRLTDFRNSIIIMTSNLGSTRSSSLGFKSYQDHDYEADIRSFFRPEFYNRIDQCLIFQSLDEATIQAITHKELLELRQRDGITQRKLKLSFSKELVAFISKEGFDPKYGARPLQREIERLIVAPLARMLVERPEIQGRKVVVDVEDNGIVFK